MPKEKILLVEDEEDILELVRYNLTREGYRVVSTATGEKALKAVKTQTFDLVVLDLMLPGIDGLEVCKDLKGNPDTRSVPVIMLTARGEEADVVAGLELGADDYIPKPFSPRVLLARVRAVLRRTSNHTEEEVSHIEIGDLTILPGHHEVRVKGKPVQLTLTEFKILILLARRPGWVYTRYQIISEVQGDDHIVTDRTVDVQMVGLRKKLGPAGKHVETVRGVGYRFRE